jgi:hypothetical protein
MLLFVTTAQHIWLLLKQKESKLLFSTYFRKCNLEIILIRCIGSVTSFHLHTVVNTKITVLVDVMRYSLKRFGGMCCLHLQVTSTNVMRSVSPQKITMWDEIITELNMKITVFCDITSCSLVDRYQFFGATCCLHLQSKTLLYYSTSTFALIYD